MEYIYILGLIGYYLYKAYNSSNRKEHKSESHAPKELETTQLPQNKSLFDYILDEINKSQEKKTEAPHTEDKTRKRIFSDHKKPLVESKNVKKSIPPKQRKINPIEHSHYQPVDIHHFENYNAFTDTEGQRVTQDAIPSKVKKVKQSSFFAGMHLSAKDAIKAQIILERKF